MCNFSDYSWLVLKNTQEKNLHCNKLNVYSLPKRLQRVKLKNIFAFVTPCYNLDFNSP